MPMFHVIFSCRKVRKAFVAIFVNVHVQYDMFQMNSWHINCYTRIEFIILVNLFTVVDCFDLFKAHHNALDIDTHRDKKIEKFFM